ncbi:MAG: hypothetical protein AB7U75_14755 [Hyphomicrobiaceae bacterium]
MSNWPKHEDGSNKKVGEMTREERRGVFKDACAKLQGQFADPRFQAGIERVLSDDNYR